MALWGKLFSHFAGLFVSNGQPQRGFSNLSQAEHAGYRVLLAEAAILRLNGKIKQISYSCSYEDDDAAADEDAADRLAKQLRRRLGRRRELAKWPRQGESFVCALTKMAMLLGRVVARRAAAFIAVDLHSLLGSSGDRTWTDPRAGVAAAAYSS